MIELLSVKHNYVFFLFCDEAPDCADELPDCADYGQSACVAPYDTWARKNCAKTCKYCGKCLSDASQLIYMVLIHVQCFIC